MTTTTATRHPSSETTERAPATGTSGDIDAASCEPLDSELHSLAAIQKQQDNLFGRPRRVTRRLRMVAGGVRVTAARNAAVLVATRANGRARPRSARGSRLWGGRFEGGAKRIPARRERFIDRRRESRDGIENAPRIVSSASSWLPSAMRLASQFRSSMQSPRSCSESRPILSNKNSVGVDR